MRVDERFRKTVVCLGAADTIGRFVPYGTGFITTNLMNLSEGWQTLVTCRHVLGNIPGDVVSVRLNTKAGSADILKFPKSDWLCHENDEVDIAVCPTSITKELFDILHLPLDRHLLAPGLPSDGDIGVGDEVFASGMFIGRLGESRNIPIIRTGTIAAMAEEPIRTEYGYHDAFLIEVKSIDGLSGSPVFIHYPPGASPHDMKKHSPVHDGTYRFMGMMLGYNEVRVVRTLDDIDIIESKTARAPVAARKVSLPLNPGIAVVMPIWKIVEAIEQPKMQERRNTMLKQGKLNRPFVAASGAPAKPEPPTMEGDEQHKERFTSLLGAAARKRPQGD